MLQELEISQWDGTDADVALLPRSLTGIQFGHQSHLGALGVSNLPQSLTQLYMGGKKLTDKGVLLLPRGLTHLCLVSKGSRSDKAIENLPRSLKELTMEWNNLTMTAEMGFPSLPRTLTSIDFCVYRKDVVFQPQDLVNLPPALTSLMGCPILEAAWKAWKSTKK
jgi:Leucine-rich repeat (LRR) protein